MTYDLIMEHFIYSCPDTYQYQSVELMTFRTAEGHMEKIIGIEQVVRLNPIDIEATFDVPQMVLDRIKGYVGVAKNRRVFKKSGLYRFYVLNEESVFDLPHKPRPKQRLEGPAYFLKSALISGESLVVPISD